VVLIGEKTRGRKSRDSVPLTSNYFLFHLEFVKASTELLTNLFEKKLHTQKFHIAKQDIKTSLN
jgi:hypothetical protein